MSRKKENIEDIRNKVLRFRCTEKEREKIRLLAKKKGLSVSDYLRIKALKSS